MQKALASASPARYRIFMKRVSEGIRGLIGASGGIGYHLAALRYASHLWQPFREALSTELVGRITTPETTDLVLIGPSGGYCFEPSFLAGFRSLVAVDIDPLAGAVLRKKAPEARVLRQDFFRRLEGEGWDLSRWLATIGAEPTSTVLFSNLLGQLGFLFGASRMAELDAGLSRALRTEVPWISFHDRFTAKVGLTPRAKLDFAQRPSSPELAKAWGVMRVEEHELGAWIDAARGPFRYLPWRLDSRRTQLIEICGNR